MNVQMLRFVFSVSWLWHRITQIYTGKHTYVRRLVYIYIFIHVNTSTYVHINTNIYILIHFLIYMFNPRI